MDFLKNLDFFSFLADKYLISGLLTLSIGLTLYIFLVPRSPSKYSMGIQPLSGGMKAMAFFSSELHAALPANVASKLVGRPTTELEQLIRRSGNPWRLRPQDFRLIQITGAALGVIVGIVVVFVLSKYTFLALPWFVGALGGMGFGYIYPKSVYNTAAAKRDLDFKRQLPEALDLLIISLSAGVTFGTALKTSLPQMKPGVLKDELGSISKSLESGKSIKESLGQFAEKAPTESIKTFVRAVQEAIELNVPLVQVLESRADASRKEFFAMLQEKTASLESRMMAVLIPTIMPALLIVLIAPSAFSIADTLL